MVFTLEALNAQFGDALLLHYGDADAPKLIVIDAGPEGVYANSVRPRLEQLRGDSDEPLPIELLMVSHIDSDHVTGVVALSRDMLAAIDNDEPAPYDVLKLWHNSFDDILGNKDAGFAALDAAVNASSAGDGTFPAGFHLNEQAAAIVANVPEGRELKRNAVRLGIFVNEEPGKLLMAPAQGRFDVDMGDGLTLTVVGPSKPRLDALQKEWDAKLEHFGLGIPASESAATLDNSPPNLSSIVVLAEADGKRILLTGDARGDFVIDGLRSAGMLDDEGKIHVDILKLPHHGSKRNVPPDFFSTVTADHYVISANGKNDNPDIPTLKMISTARTDDDFTIHLTNWEQRLEDFFEQEKQHGRNYTVVFREDDDAVSLRIDLSDPLEA
ncbi:MAG TPA: hypothetical protein VGP08_04285 [Pyrinomonadaceae bacterium]|jgi:hypothetical protein|nr:hypothetical protein [Pyrinomonadaceae bacterium]